MEKPGAVYTEAAEPLVPPPHDHRHPPLTFYGVPVGDYPEEPPTSPRPYLLIPLYRGGGRRQIGGRPGGCCGGAGAPIAALRVLLVAGILLGSAAFVLWPSDPEVRLDKLKLKSIKVSSKHKGTLVALDVAMDVRVRVRNRAVFALDYDNVTVGIEYRGRTLGTAVALGGTVEARGELYAAAKLRLDGIRVLEDALFLIEDLLKGNIPFDTVTHLDGDLRFLSFQLPIQGRISCAINVDVDNQIIASQDCYPEQAKE